MIQKGSYMKKQCAVFFLVTFFSCHSNMLLQAPKPLLNHDIEQLAQEWTTHFTWRFGNVGSFSLLYEQQQSGFSLKALGLPLYMHGYRILPNQKEFKNILIGMQYYFVEPLIVFNGHPQVIELEHLSTYIAHQRCIFYTGAGISAGTVATMYDLMQSLEMTSGKMHFFKHVWSEPKKTTDAFSEFCNKAIYGEPLQAHIALRDIALLKSCAIITENVDLLQHRTGIAPIHTAEPVLRTITSHELQAVQAIVCIGLSHDDRGFLRLYKKCNPKGIIIALDLKAPNYLSDNDYIHYGDIQKALPDILHYLLSR